MSMYKKVLVAVDVYGGTDDVLSKAAQFQKENQSELIVLDVITPLPQVYGSPMGGITIPENYEANLKEIEEDHLAKLKDLLKEKSIPESAALVTPGRPSNKIIEIAEEQNVDLILLGSHGRHGIDLLLGSTANGVLHRAKCDVLAIRVKE